MTVRQVQVRGCLPTLVVLLVVGAVLAAITTASVAFVALAAAAGLVAGGLRWARRLAGRKAPPSGAPRASDVTIDAEILPPQESGEPPPKRLE